MVFASYPAPAESVDPMWSISGYGIESRSVRFPIPFLEHREGLIRHLGYGVHLPSGKTSLVRITVWQFGHRISKSST
jgi:hypothetical protein